MLVHLVQNKQLKKTLRKQEPMTYILVDGNGLSHVPISLTITSSFFKGAPLASFEIQATKGPVIVSPLTTAKTFNELLQYFKDQFLPAISPKNIQKVLQSQSLTITYVVEQLGVPRTDAKEFIERCVNVGAFKKYYSYWVRTDIFSSWISQHEEKS